MRDLRHVTKMFPTRADWCEPVQEKLDFQECSGKLQGKQHSTLNVTHTLPLARVLNNSMSGVKTGPTQHLTCYDFGQLPSDLMMLSTMVTSNRYSCVPLSTQSSSRDSRIIDPDRRRVDDRHMTRDCAATANHLTATSTQDSTVVSSRWPNGSREVLVPIYARSSKSTRTMHNIRR